MPTLVAQTSRVTQRLQRYFAENHWSSLIVRRELHVISMCDQGKQMKSARPARLFREQPRGVENSGGWKTYRKFGEKPIPKNVFGPPTYDTFPPPFFGDSLSFPLKERGTDQTNPNF